MTSRGDLKILHVPRFGMGRGLGCGQGQGQFCWAQRPNDRGSQAVSVTQNDTEAANGEVVTTWHTKYQDLVVR